MPGLLELLLGRAAKSEGPSDEELQTSVDDTLNSLAERVYTGQLPSPELQLPRPARGQPSLERAAHVLTKKYPRDMHGVEFGYEPNIDLTNILAHVPSTDTRQALFNLSFATVAPDDQIQGTAAHELQHIRDFRDEKINKYERLVPWEKRPSEQRAMKAEQDFLNARQPGTHDDTDNYVRRSFFDWVESSPSVKEWIAEMNRVP